MNMILPIGSVVKLKGLNKPIMIFGYLQKTGMKPDNVADYLGVPYPEGNISLAHQVPFMMESIEEVLFEGYQTDEFKPIGFVLSARKLIGEDNEDQT